MIKPFSLRKLIARVGATLNRVRQALAGKTLTLADIAVDTADCKFRRAGLAVPLGPT